MPSFLEAFFSLAAARFGSPGERWRISQALAAAARKMFTSRSDRLTLDTVFLRAFAPAVGLDTETARARFVAFYDEEFQRLRRLVRPLPAARPLLERALTLGYGLVLATNPVFFREGILSRARWAGLEGIPFLLVTCAETMRRAKPHPGYFTQVLELTGRRPGECLMVGDDPRMDLAAKDAGIATWLAVRPGEIPEPGAAADFSGTLEELAVRLENPDPG